LILQGGRAVTFSEFANMMYPFCGNGDKIADYTIRLVDNVLCDPLTTEDQEKFNKGKYNPLSKLSVNGLEKIYRGERNISKKNATEMKIDSANFDEYISKLPDDSLKGIAEAFLQFEIAVNKSEVAKKSAETFAEILIALASGTKKSTKTDDNLPYPRNRFFTGRDDVIQKIYDGFASGNLLSLTQSLSAAGGFGKTQTALEFAYRYKNEYSVVWWVNATTHTTADEAFEKFAKLKKLQGKSISETRRNVINWLGNHSSWLFIFDNADDTDILIGYLPNDYRGNVLITTRSAVPKNCTKIDIGVFTQKEALAFLRKRTEILDDDENALELADRLGYLPLALEHAAAYINVHTKRYADYIRLLKNEGAALFDVLGKPKDYHYTVRTTWRISMAAINNESSVQMLNICSYFAPDNIPVDLLFADERVELPNPLKEEMSTELKRDRVTVELTKYSLVSKNRDGELTVHRLVQEVLHDDLKEDKTYIAYALGIIGVVFGFDFAEISNFRRMVDHALCVAENVFEKWGDEGKLKIITWIYGYAGFGFHELGDYPNSLKWHKKAYEVGMPLFGDKHMNTMKYCNNIAEVYSQTGNAKEALQWHEQALAVCDRAMPEESAETATLYNNLGTDYQAFAEYEKAFYWIKNAMEIRERVLGKNHIDTAQSYNNIGLLYRMSADLDTALEYHKKALTIRENELGKAHPTTCMSYTNIAGIYHLTGHSDIALVHYEYVLETLKKVYGDEHPDIATAYNNMAACRSKESVLDKALELYRIAMNMRKKLLGENHPDTLSSCNNLAIIMRKMGNTDSALDLQKRILTIRRKTCGEIHPQTATSYNSVAATYYHKQKFDKALKLFLTSLEINTEVYGKSHPETQIARDNLAIAYKGAKEAKPNNYLLPFEDWLEHQL
jgi:tetratricopeptide (TPR) repeat protein